MRTSLTASRITALAVLCFLLWLTMPATARDQGGQPSEEEIGRRVNAHSEGLAVARNPVMEIQKYEKELESKKAADLALGLKHFQIAKNVTARLSAEEKHILSAAIVPELERLKALVGHDKQVPVESKLQNRETREKIRAIRRNIKAKVEKILGTKKVQELEIFKPIERVLLEPHSCWYAYYSQVYSLVTLDYAYYTYWLYGTSLDYYTYVYAYYSDVYAWYAYLNLC